MASTQVDISSTGELYKHQPLDVKKHQIRLLKLHNPWERTMHYRLTTFDCESVPSYIALSYTWGEKHPTGFVSIDSKRFEIRMNLFNFLSTYRTEEYLWIDQICIDQSNAQEQSHQVELLWKIYSRCRFVLVWLRDEKTYTPSTRQAALDFNDGICSYLKSDGRGNGSSSEKECLNSPTLALFHNSYFDRLWIVQELLLGEDVRILVEGNVWVLWKSLVRKHEERQDEIRKILPSTSWMVEMRIHRSTFAKHTPVNTSYYITLTAGRYYDKKCENPRDKVYGFMGLVDSARKLEIDYAKSVQQVYLDAVMSMIREYWYMIRDTRKYGYQLHYVKWNFKINVKGTWGLAQAMASTDLEKSGLKSFVKCVWERVLRHELTAKSLGVEVDPETYCIASMGFDREADQLSEYRRLKTCDRWWYEFGGERRYHDCKEWLGDSKLQEYTESQGVRVYGF
jgi:hypothetical protein